MALSREGISFPVWRALPEQALVVLAQPTGLGCGLTPTDIEFRSPLVRRLGIPGLGRFARSLPGEPVDHRACRIVGHTVDPAITHTVDPATACATACATARSVAHAR